MPTLPSVEATTSVPLQQPFELAIIFLLLKELSSDYEGGAFLHREVNSDFDCFLSLM
jgi:hypothetical protein